MTRKSRTDRIKNRPNLGRSFVTAFVLLSLTSCAAPEKTVHVQDNSPYQKLSVITPGQTGAHCFLQTGMRSYSVSTPSEVTVRRDATPMVVTCFKGDHLKGTSVFHPTVAKSEAQNIKGTDKNCVSCQYPATIAVAMGLNENSLSVNLKQIQ